MPDYKLSELAKTDLLGIASFGDENFGIEKSNRYRDQLKQRFLLLAEQPYLYAAVEIMRVLGRQSLGRLDD